MTLQELRFDDTLVEDIAPLAKLSLLKVLWFADTPVRNLSALRHLSKLESLDISSTKVHNVLPLLKLTKLFEVQADNTELSPEDIEHLRKTLPNCSVYLEGPSGMMGSRNW